MMNRGPLSHVAVTELAGLAPAPYCGMVLSDFGARVIRVDKVEDSGFSVNRCARGKRSVALNLGKPEGANVLKKLCRISDVLIDPYRPGVLEKLGLGPEILLAENQRLIYARISGYGQSGPWSRRAGHDINYIALSGLLSILGRKNEKPYAPLNLLADFGGGGLTCVVGILICLIEREKSGHGQVIDMSMYTYNQPKDTFPNNHLKGSKHMIRVLEELYALFDGTVHKKCKKTEIGMSEISLEDMLNDEGLRKKLEERFREKSRSEWCELFQHSDACVAPVLELGEVGEHIHHKNRGAFVNQGSGWQPRPAPRLSRTPSVPVCNETPESGQHSCQILSELGYTKNDIQKYLEEGLIRQHRNITAKL